MIFSQKLQLIRKNKGLTQEELAGKLDVSRQAVAKWESGQVYPDISNLIQISKLFNVTVDYLVKDQECTVGCFDDSGTDVDRLIEFRLEANVNTYAAYMNETDSTRLDSHDFSYSNGSYTYHDTYVGGEQFAGEEAIWYEGKSQYAMNYIGRVLNQNFNGDFLKEALRKADKKCHLEDQSIINQDNIPISVMQSEIFPGFKVMKKFTVRMLRYMNAIITVE